MMFFRCLVHLRGESAWWPGLDLELVRVLPRNLRCKADAIILWIYKLVRNCREGMTVVATRRNDEKVKETVREINKLGTSTIHHP